MKTPEDEAFDELARKQGAWGGGFPAKRAMAADKLHWSDCAVHNAPAYPAGECDCGATQPWNEDEWRRNNWRCGHGWLRGEQCEICNAPQPAQEPVAWAVVGDGKFGKYEIGRETLTDIDSANYWISRGYKLVSIYTTPPQRTWVGLTDAEIDKTYWRREPFRRPTQFEFARDIEQLLKEKNND